MLFSVGVALLLGLVWLRFFRQIDIFEPEGWKPTVFCLGLGAISPLLVAPIVGLSPFLRSLSEESSGTELFQFALLRVAAVEEFVKLIPFLLALRFRGWVNESLDYLKYPALSAIGFASIENIMYAGIYGVNVLHIRGLLCISGHIFYAVLPGYFLWKSLKFSPWIRILFVFTGYAFGVFAHGLYDYFLFERFADLEWFSILLCAGCMWIMKRLLIEAVGKSHFFRESGLDEIFNSGWILFKGLLGIYILVGLIRYYQNGLPAAFHFFQQNFFYGIVGTTVLVFLLAIDEKDRKHLLSLFQRRSEGPPAP
jgi:RsiW-degrading membrane proteinase PrsW (M82 family)